MKKIYFIYIFFAVVCVALCEGAKVLIQKGVAQDDTMFWIYCFLSVGILFGRLSVYIEYQYRSKNKNKR